MALRPQAVAQATRGPFEDRFSGSWEDDEGTLVIVRDSMMYGPEGSAVELKIKSSTACSFMLAEKEFRGNLDGEDRLVWDDGGVWQRKKGAGVARDEETATRRRPEEPQQAECVRQVAAEGVLAASAADEAIEAERARKSAALERARVARAAGQAQQQPATEGPDFQAAKARSEAGQDRARRAFEEEKARKAMALERARARAAESKLSSEGPLDAKGESLDRARRAFDEEKARRAAALEQARSRAVAQASGSGFEETELASATKAFEAEQARKAAALARARAGATEAAAKARDDGQQLPSREFADAKARSEAGMDRARRAYEAEKAKRAAARERARAKASGSAEDELTRAAGSGRFAPGRPTAGSNFGWSGGGPLGGAGGLGGRGAIGSLGGLGGGRPGFGFGTGLRGMQQYDAPMALTPGILVKMQGLSAQPELNGQVATLVRFSEEKGRWQVRMDGRPDVLLKADNLVALSVEEYEAMQEGTEEEDDDLVLDLQTKASGEAMRWADGQEGDLEQAPGDEGNVFDVLMAAETDGVAAAEKIARVLVQRGVCTCEANAPHDLLSAAFDEAEALWEAGEFGPPMTCYDEDSQLEAQIWQQMLYHDESRVLWINEDSGGSSKMDMLKLLSANMWDFCRGIANPLLAEAGLSFTHFWSAMLSCYTGDQTYNLHIDNPNGNGENGLPDNGLRLSLCYYINPHWNPEDGYNGGGLDVYLTDPRETPSYSAARKARRMRIAPHADTLVLFLSQRMGHRIIATKGKERWFALWLWCWDEQAMQHFSDEVSRTPDGDEDDD